MTDTAVSFAILKIIATKRLRMMIARSRIIGVGGTVWGQRVVMFESDVQVYTPDHCYYILLYQRVS
jgi:hypothetical protein